MLVALPPTQTPSQILDSRARDTFDAFLSLPTPQPQADPQWATLLCQPLGLPTGPPLAFSIMPVPLSPGLAWGRRLEGAF